jgi:hypothetical protein
MEAKKLWLVKQRHLLTRSTAMKKLLTLTFALAVLATFSGLATAATTGNSSESYSSDRVAADKASPKLLKGRVTGVNSPANTFTLAVAFSAEELSQLPTAGEMIVISYIETPRGQKATSVKSSKSNSQDRMAADKASPSC